MIAKEALQVARDAHPALILLDIMMPPGIDGFEVCRRLKADPRTRDAVVIFLSARDDVEARVEGFDVGGVDYVVVTSSAGASRIYATGGLRFSDRLDGTRLTDEQGRAWTVTEEALEPEEKGLPAAPRVEAHRVFWFAWYTHYPETELIR